MPPGRGWLFVVISIFSLGIIWMTFNLVFGAYMIPEFRNIVNDDNIGGALPSEDKVTINNAYDNYMVYYKLMPFILIFIAIIYFFVVTFRRERESQYVG